MSNNSRPKDNSQNAPILLDIDHHIATVTLNRPESLNAFSEPEMINAFLDILDEIEETKDIRAVILTGAGKAFSAGGNVKHMKDKTDMFAGSESDIEQAYLNGILRVPPRFYNLNIPTIAAVNGAAFGAALDLVCMCDFRIGSHHASFGAPFVKIGIAPGDGAAWFLPRLIGQAKAAEMLLMAKPMDSEAALQYGLISTITEAEDLLPTARKMAKEIAKNAPLAVRETKQLMKKAQHSTLENHLKDCAAAQGRLHHTDDHMEALDAFFEKRPGVYHGK